MKKVIPVTYRIDVDPLDSDAMELIHEKSDGTVLYNLEKHDMIPRAHMLSDEKKLSLMEQGYEELYCVQDKKTGHYKPITPADCIILFNGNQKEVMSKKMADVMFEEFTEHSEHKKEEILEEIVEKPTPKLAY